MRKITPLLLFFAVLFIFLDLAFAAKLYVLPKIAPTPTVTLTPTETPIPTPVPLSADKLFQLVNEWRVQNGYQEYKKSDFACSVASKRLPEVKENWSHEGFYYKRFCQECTLSENLAKGQPSEKETLKNWVNSPSHLANLQRTYTHACIVTDGDYFVQIFSYF